MSDGFAQGFIEDFPERALQAAERSAVRRAIVTGRAVAAREVQKHNNLKIGDIKRFLKVSLSSEKTGNVISYKGGHIPLLYFGAKYANGGYIAAKVEKSSGYKTFHHAFVKPNGKYPIGIYQRESVKQFPISQLQGPSIPQIIMAHDDIAGKISQAQNETFQKRLEHNIEALVNDWWEKKARGKFTQQAARVRATARAFGVDVDVAMKAYLNGENWTYSDYDAHSEGLGTNPYWESFGSGTHIWNYADWRMGRGRH